MVFSTRFAWISAVTKHLRVFMWLVLRCGVVPQHHYAVYIVSNNTRSTLYIGVTNDLPLRLWQHRNPDRRSFAARYHCVHLVFFEVFREVRDAIAREKQLKGWRRSKKDELIEKMNPGWRDLAADWFD